jgi:hypothetical protein
MSELLCINERNVHGGSMGDLCMLMEQNLVAQLRCVAQREKCVGLVREL